MRIFTLLLPPLLSTLANAANPISSIEMVSSSQPIRVLGTHSQMSSDANTLKKLHDERTIATLAAEIDKQNRNYQKRPRTAFSSSPQTVSVALYIENWQQKIERIGTIAYPIDSEGRKLYGQVSVRVEIAADGRMLNAQIIKSSANQQLDEGVMRILKMSAPFAKLPPDLLDSKGLPAEILVITRTWTFEHQTRQIDKTKKDASTVTTETP